MDPRERFTDRVASYVAARPGYPAELIELLREECGLNPNCDVADIGAGTGILSRMLCEVAHAVIAVEPNQAMRGAGQQYLVGFENFKVVNGSAESTNLPATSFDLITVAQAFHWFDQKEARHEFMRILKPNGFAAIIWNDRQYEGTPFAEAYERLLMDHGTDYADVKVRGKSANENFDRFFGHSEHKKRSIKNAQSLDRDGFVQRVVSASYMPNPEHPRYAAMISDVERVFEEFQKDGRVVIDYTTNVYYGQMS